MLAVSASRPSRPAKVSAGKTIGAAFRWNAHKMSKLKTKNPKDSERSSAYPSFACLRRLAFIELCRLYSSGVERRKHAHKANLGEDHCRRFCRSPNRSTGDKFPTIKRTGGG